MLIIISAYKRTSHPLKLLMHQFLREIFEKKLEDKIKVGFESVYANEELKLLYFFHFQVFA